MKVEKNIRSIRRITRNVNNRIVVNYGEDERLVLLSVYQNNGREIPRADIEEHLDDSFDLVSVYNFAESWEHLMSRDEPNREGYVIRFANGFRMKIKFPEYVRLHRIVTNISNIDIWKTLKENGNLDDILDSVPDEFYNWVRRVERELQEKRKELLAAAHADFAYIVNNVLGYQVTRKEYAEEFAKHPRAAIFFKWLDGKKNDVERMSWDLVRPEFSKPFSNVDENS